ncbi:MAG: hypothetical protein P4L40_13415 [Terracidiphilus sp.]|nr:hypothetical protein [Terracidiphilus sp.]
MNPRHLIALFLALLCLPPLVAQKQKRQPLNERQIDQIREAGIFPNDRIKLYVQFVGAQVDAIEALGKRGKSSARTARLDDALLDLVALIDELGSNLDQYGDRKADVRTALKALNETVPHWRETLRAVPQEPGIDLSRKEALESLNDLSEQTIQLEKEQIAYFQSHKDEQGQDRAEPK